MSAPIRGVCRLHSAALFCVKKGGTWCSFVQHVRQLKRHCSSDVSLTTTSGQKQRPQADSAEKLSLIEEAFSHNASDRMVQSKMGRTLELTNNASQTENPVLERTVGLFPDDQMTRLKLPPDQPVDAKVLRVAIIGAPNSGKSTLTNTLMSWKLMPVSTRAHTTRNNTSAVLTEGNTQIIFLDTPGVVSYQDKKKHNLERALILDPEKSLHEADMVVVLVDAADKWTKNKLSKNVLKLLYLHNRKPSVLVLNKVDAVGNKENLLEITHKLTCGRIKGQDVLRKIIKGKLSQEQKIKANSEYKNRIIEKYHAKKMASILTEDDGKYLQSNKSLVSEVAEDDTSSFKSSSDFSEDYIHDNVEESKENFGSEKVHKMTEKMKGLEDLDIKNSMDKEKGLKSTDSVGPDGVRRDDSLSIDMMLQRGMESYVRKMQELEKVVEDQEGWPDFDAIFMISAVEQDGVNDLRNYFFANARFGNWEYNSSVVTDEDPQALAKMIVWEKVLENCHGYTPFKVFPKITLWHVDESGTLNISMELDAKKHYFAGIIKGEGNMRISSIHREAAKELKNMFQQEVYLQVKVTYKLTEQQVKQKRRIERLRQKIDRFKSQKNWQNHSY